MHAFFKKTIVVLLTLEARIALWVHGPRAVGITGSVGKTSTKEAVVAVARRLGTARASQKSYNSELGLPLTVLGLDTAWNSAVGWMLNVVRGVWHATFGGAYPSWLVLELGVDHPGDMEKAVSLVHLDTAIITHIGTAPVHVEFFPSPADVVAEKARIIEALADDGTLILAYDDESVRALKGSTRARTYTFGLKEGADVYGAYYAITYDDADRPTGAIFKVLHGGNVVPIVLSGIVGRQTMYPTLAAVAFGLAHGLNLVEIGDALSSRDVPPGRMRLLRGVQDTTLIDDTYNASPIAVREALLALKDIKTKGRRIAVLGDMAELGVLSDQEHEAVGAQCKGVDVVVTVGNGMRRARDGAKDAGVKRVESFENSRDAGLFVKGILKKGDVVLCKGSQSMRMERAVREILAHPEQSHTLLVRQGREWERR